MIVKELAAYVGLFLCCSKVGYGHVPVCSTYVEPV